MRVECNVFIKDFIIDDVIHLPAERGSNWASSYVGCGETNVFSILPEAPVASSPAECAQLCLDLHGLPYGYYVSS